MKSKPFTVVAFCQYIICSLVVAFNAMALYHAFVTKTDLPLRNMLLLGGGQVVVGLVLGILVMLVDDMPIEPYAAALFMPMFMLGCLTLAIVAGAWLLSFISLKVIVGTVVGLMLAAFSTLSFAMLNRFRRQPMGHKAYGTPPRIATEA